MTRWFTRRWVWATLAGASLTVGIAASQAQEGPPKVGTVISLNIDGKGERQFKVIKSERQPDGSYHSELKDTKTGETITLLDKPVDNPPTPPAPPETPTLPTPMPPAPTKAPETPETSKTPNLPKAKPRVNDPLLPPVASTLPDVPKEKEKEKERRPILGRIFSDRDKDKDKLPSATESMKVEPTEGGKKPGIIARIFSPKKPT